MAVTEPELDRLTNETVELLQTMIRNECVNDGSDESGFEDRSARLLGSELEGLGLDLERYETGPERSSLVTRIKGTDPDAPSLCLMGHTDVVPVSPDGWDQDPFGGELIDGEVWGRGAVDMLNLTSSMAVAFRHLARTGQRPKGDLIYFAVADEEAGGTNGAKVLLENHWDHLQCDYVLTEFGGIPINDSLLLTTAEKGVAWRRLHVGGTPGHGSMPYQTDNALVTAAEVVRRLSEYNPGARLDKMWEQRVRAMGLGDEFTAQMLDPATLYSALDLLPPELARNSHACCHTTFSPNVIHGGVKTNVIPDEVSIDLDIRTLPGETSADVDEHLRTALGDLHHKVRMEVIIDEPASESATDNPMWDALQGAMLAQYPQKELVPTIVTGATDARYFRDKGAIAYGAGLLSPSVSAPDFLTRFHGHNERIDIESLRMTTRLWFDVMDRFWA